MIRYFWSPMNVLTELGFYVPVSSHYLNKFSWHVRSKCSTVTLHHSRENLLSLSSLSTSQSTILRHNRRVVFSLLTCSMLTGEYSTTQHSNSWSESNHGTICTWVARGTKIMWNTSRTVTLSGQTMSRCRTLQLEDKDKTDDVVTNLSITCFHFYCLPTIP